MRVRISAVLIALVLPLSACGGSDPAGLTVSDQEIEQRITAAIVDQSDDGYEYEVNCPDDGIEAGTDFSCIATPIGLDGVHSVVDTHLASDGETIDSFKLDPVLEDPSCGTTC